MGKKSDHRKAEAKLRAEAEAALKLEFDGRHEEAIARVDDLAARHEESAPVLHLAANVHDAAANRAYRAGDDDASARHYRTARGYLIKARELVPNCISIANFLANVLFRSGEVDEAEKVAREAVGIADPVDPAKNNVAYASRAANTTRDQRVLNCRNLARQTLGEIGRSSLPARVSEVLKLDTGAHDGSREALTKAKELAKSYPSSSRAQLLFAHMQLQRVRLLHPDMDRRGFLDRIRADVKQAIASTFGNSLVFAMFHAKLCFVLGLYADAHFECVRAFDMPEPVDPRLEDVPPRSVQGDTLELRLRSVDEELGRLVNKLFSVADAFRCSMSGDRQAGFLSLGLLQLQDYYHQNFGSYQWAVAQTISDALTFVSQNRSWRFWICPFCAGNKLPNTDSLLEHINSKHLRKLRSVFGSVLPQYFIEDDVLDDITIYQDSEGHHFFRFNNKDYVFACLSVPTQELSIAGVQDKICQRGKEILQDIEVKLKSLPADELSAEFDTARSEIQHLWDAFLRNSFLDYRILIKKLARPFIWTKLLQSLSEDKAASKLSNADIDVIFPNVVDMREVHAEDNVGRLEIHPNSSIADVQSGAAGLKYVPSNANENSASNLLGSSSQSSQETSISLYRKSIEVLGKDTDIFVLNFIIQILWNWRGFRDEFLKRRPVCTLPSHQGPCISQMLYTIFSGWQKDDHHRTYSLISIRDTICQVLSDSTVFQNVKVNTSSYIVTTILNALLMPEVFLEVHYPKDAETLKQPANPAMVLCNKAIICEGFGIKNSTACGDKPNAEPLQIEKGKSIADDKCRQVDPLSVSTPEFSTVGKYVPQEQYIAILNSLVTSQFLVMHCAMAERENQRTLREVIKSLTLDPDYFFFLDDPNISPDTMKCTFVSMIFYHEGKLLGIVREYQNKWLVFVHNDGVATEFNSWEDLLHGYGDHEIQHCVYFFEIIKIIIK